MKFQKDEISWCILNGFIAIAVHYGVLTTNLGLLDFKSTGLENFIIATIFGIATSYFSNYFYVFNRTTGGVLQQTLKFSELYGAMAAFNPLLYRIGFLFATDIRVSLKFLGNKLLVFKE